MGVKGDVRPGVVAVGGEMQALRVGFEEPPEAGFEVAHEAAWGARVMASRTSGGRPGSWERGIK